MQKADELCKLANMVYYNKIYIDWKKRIRPNINKHILLTSEFSTIDKGN